MLSSAAGTASADENADAKTTCAARAERGQREKLDGHLRAARADFIACAQDTCPAAVRQACSDWLTETEHGVPTIVIVVRDANGVSTAPTRAWIDDEEIDVSSGRAVSVDPGPHAVRARGASEAEATTRIVVIEGRKAEVVPIVIGTPAPSPAPRAADADRPRSTFTTGRWIAVGIAGAGVLGLGAGGLLALSAQSRYDDSAAFCTGNECDPTGLAIRSEGIDRANVATVVSVASLVAIAAGVVLWLATPP
jgi:hypothetical protein